MVVIDDAGRLINPMIVDGQIQGAAAQAIGQILLEELVYGDDGQLRTTTLADYAIPIAGTVPRVDIGHRETPSPLLGGFRGAGEAAIVSGPAAIVNAIADAVAPLGVRITQTNLSSSRLRGLLRDAGVSIDPVAGRRFTRPRPPQHGADRLTASAT
jgi:carbon-monoxide dehydrogenase large subunit